jgi:asparagine synthase (glutamine-hydrolysing)
MLVKVDQMSMANGLEVRPAFLDYRVVELANALPVASKFNGRRGKIVLEKTFGHLLPESVFKRRKQGFEVPLERWLRGPLKPVIQESVLRRESRLYEVLNYEKTNALVEAFYKNEDAELTTCMYALFIADRWLESMR